MIVEKIEIVSAFKRNDGILLHRGVQIEEVARRYQGQITQLNTPDRAPAEFPRLVVRFQDASLQVAPTRFQVSLKTPSHVAETYVESMAHAMNRTQPIFEALCEESTYDWTGIVCTIAYPEDISKVSSGIESAIPFFSRLTTLPWETSDLVSFELKVGRRSGAFFWNYILNGYETYEVVAPTPESIVIDDLGRDSLVGVGFNISIDVNNKPSAERTGPIFDLQSAAKEHELAFESLSKDLNLEGMI